jgi:hypothetical protein
MAKRSARSIAFAYSGKGKFANKPATTTIKASAIANTRLRILKFENNPIILAIANPFLLKTFVFNQFLML